ncbi:MAG: DUF4080 domain-containing protein [Desulfofustis sp.]|nr:DUF4080 domain-containing protein [Desulfofustis sp.]
MKIKLIGINARYSHSCLALFYLRNELELNLSGVDAEICQYTINDPYYILLQRIAAGRPDYLFFSALIWNSDLIERLIEDLLTLSERVRILVGGPQAPVVCAPFGADPRVSCYVGEIEAAPEGFYRDLEGFSLQPLYRGSFLQMREQHLAYPYRHEDFSRHLANRAVYYESSRGCPFFCTYCLSSAETGLYHKDLDAVFSDLDELLGHRPKTVRFVDRTFNDVPKRALAIWEYIREKDAGTLFHFEIAPDRFSEEMFDFLESVRPGLFQFEIGIQTTNPETLEAIRRPMDPAQAGPVIRRLRRMETIHLHADLILGLPYETADSFRRSINDIFTMQPHYVQMGLLKLLPATRMTAQAAEFGFRAQSRPPYALLSNRWMDAAVLAKFFWLGECLEQFVNNRYFPSLWHYLVGEGADMAGFFSHLAVRFSDQGYFFKAATQETLCRLLIEQTTGRQDFAIIRELLCFDWLRCGHRYLPDFLSYRAESLEELRRDAYHRLPREIDGLYTIQERRNFIKSSVFQIFSQNCLHSAGFWAARECALACFCSAREDSVLRLAKTAILQITD